MQDGTKTTTENDQSDSNIELADSVNTQAEDLELRLIDTRLIDIFADKSKVLEISSMKLMEIRLFEEKIEVGFLEKSVYYTTMVYRLIKLIYPIIIPLLIIFGWLNTLKTNKER
jgi:hypothetical protein